MKYLDQELDTRTVGAFVGLIGFVVLLEGRPDSVGQWLGMTGAMVAFYIVWPVVVWIVWAVLFSAILAHVGSVDRRQRYLVRVRSFQQGTTVVAACSPTAVAGTIRA